MKNQPQQGCNALPRNMVIYASSLKESTAWILALQSLQQLGQWMPGRLVLLPWNMVEAMMLEKCWLLFVSDLLLASFILRNKPFFLFISGVFLPHEILLQELGFSTASFMRSKPSTSIAKSSRSRCFFIPPAEKMKNTPLVRNPWFFIGNFQIPLGPSKWGVSY